MGLRRFWRALAFDRCPLNVTRGACDLLPIIAKKNFEIFHVPLVRCWCPRAFKASRCRIVAFTCAVCVDPAKALLRHWRAFWLYADIIFWACAVTFTEGVTPGNKRNSLFVIHRHTGKCVANVKSRL